MDLDKVLAPHTASSGYSLGSEPFPHSLAQHCVAHPGPLFPELQVNHFHCHLPPRPPLNCPHPQRLMWSPLLGHKMMTGTGHTSQCGIHEHDIAACVCPSDVQPSPLHPPYTSHTNQAQARLAPVVQRAQLPYQLPVPPLFQTPQAYRQGLPTCSSVLSA